MKLYIVLKNKEPIKASELDEELLEFYEETQEKRFYFSAMEIAFISNDYEAIESWKLQCEEFYFPNDEISIGELHLIVSEKEWN